MELPAAARRLLLQQPAVTGYVGSKVHKHQLWDHVDQKGTRAIVVRMAGGWEQPDRVQTSQFPLLAVDCWADCSRGETGDKLAEDAVDNAWAVYRVVDPVLHRVRNALWGASGADPEGAYVVESFRWQEPFHAAKGDGFGGNFSGVPYRVEMGESAVVMAQYAVHLA
jgi:hypothetical protein